MRRIKIIEGQTQSIIKTPSNHLCLMPSEPQTAISLNHIVLHAVCFHNTTHQLLRYPKHIPFLLAWKNVFLYQFYKIKLISFSFCYKNITIATCFTAILILREFTDPSIRTFSFSFLLITTGVSSSSLLVLQKNNPNFSL